MHKTNQCFLVGNLGGEPIERGRSEKGPIVGFSLAENVQTYDKEARQYKTVHTNWFHVTAFGSMGERVKKHLKKGDRVAVQGRIQTSKYTTKTGEEKSGFEIIADEVALWQPMPAAFGSQNERAGNSPAVRTAHAEEYGESLPF